MTNQIETTYTVIVKSDKKIEDREVTESISHTLKIKGIENYSIKTGSVTDEKSAFQEWLSNAELEVAGTGSVKPTKEMEQLMLCTWNAALDAVCKKFSLYGKDFDNVEELKEP